MQEEYTLMLPKNALVSDLLEALQKKANISDETMQKVRVYEAHMHRYHKSLPLDYSIMSLYDYMQIVVAPFPEDESPKRISVFHYDKEPSKPHGMPFPFSLKEVGSDFFVRLSDIMC
jgi:ubiquitin carboxyl-terminal hydrolase 7